MKKVLSGVLAASMALSMASAAFAATSLTPGAGVSTTGSKKYEINFRNGNHGNRTEYEIKKNNSNDKIVLYNYGDTDEVQIYLQGVYTSGSVDGGNLKTDVEKIRVDVNEGKVKVNFKKFTGREYLMNPDLENDNKGGYYGYITIKADAGLRDFKEEDFTIDVDVDQDSGQDYTFFIKGKVAYSHVRDVSEDDKYANRDTDEEGCMYNFDSVIDKESRIRPNEYIDLYFKGNYGTDKENLRVWTDGITEVENYFDDVDVDYYDFRAEPKFATKIKVIIDADANSYIYDFNKSTGELTRIDAKYESDGWAFTTKVLGCYVITEEEYEAGNVKEDVTDDKDTTITDETPIKTNPGTGAYIG